MGIFRRRSSSDEVRFDHDFRPHATGRLSGADQRRIRAAGPITPAQHIAFVAVVVLLVVQPTRAAIFKAYFFAWHTVYTALDALRGNDEVPPLDDIKQRYNEATLKKAFENTPTEAIDAVVERTVIPSRPVRPADLPSANSENTSMSLSLGLRL